MSNPLDPIWEAYQTSHNAVKVVRRCNTLKDIDSERPFRNTRFHGLPRRTSEKLLRSAQQSLEDQTVLALYAAFEATLRDHIAKQSEHLRDHVKSPTARFGKRLACLYKDQCSHMRMDDVAGLLSSRVGEDIVAKIGSIRVYRHWIAHGRRGSTPPSVTPQFAYEVLTKFLQRCHLG